MGQRITIDKLWFEFGKDVLYQRDVVSNSAIKNTLDAIGFIKTGFNLDRWCRKIVPGNDYPPLTLTLVLCGMDELNTFMPSEKEPTGWKYESFSRNYKDDLEVELDDLKCLMRKRELPLPVSLFPNAPDNTEKALANEEKEFGEGWGEAVAQGEIEDEISEWEMMNPATITEKAKKDDKLTELNASLRKMKAASYPHEPYPELSFDNLTRLADLDAELYSSPYDSSLSSELDDRLGKLINDGYEPEKAKAILQEIINKGEILREIKGWEETKTPTATDKAIQKKELTGLNKKMQALDSASDTQSKTRKAERSDPDKRQLALIEKVRELMNVDTGSGSWQSERKSREGLLTFIWRKHSTAIQNQYGNVERETVRKKTTPKECIRLGVAPLPKG